jgi:predicted alpha/beta superfamily hydrolase
MNAKNVIKFGLLGVFAVTGSAFIAGMAGAAAGTALVRSTYDEPTSAISGQTIDVHSEVLGHTLTLRVRVPAGHRPGDSTVPIIWTLDGSSRGPRVFTTMEALSRIDLMRPSIVVEVPESAAGRTADFVPPGITVSGIQGRANSFLSFLETEAMPAVEAGIRNGTGPNVLVGHSLGGVFVTYALTERPDLFDGWFAFSPSWWVGEGVQAATLEGFLRETPELSTFLYATLGSGEGNEMSRYFEVVRDVLEDNAPAGFVMGCADYAGRRPWEQSRSLDVASAP